MSNKSNGNRNQDSAKVLKLGFNISVSGEPGTDFEIVLDDKEQSAIQSSSQDVKQFQASDALKIKNSTIDEARHELEKTNTQEVSHAHSESATVKHKNTIKNPESLETSKMNELGKEENFISEDKSIISQIKSTMEHFEKFSDHIKEIPRLKNCPIATSTPISDKYNSKSESNLVYPEFRQRKYSYFYDLYPRKDYVKSSVKPIGSDLFLKPLPGEGYYKRGIYSRCYDFEPYRHYGSDNTLNKTSDYKNVCLKSSYEFDKYEGCNLPPEPPSGILKKVDSESGDKQSTSSADSIKDIKIFQSGGILIMQNFKDSMDSMEKKEMSEFSAKLIENCNKLKMEVNSFLEEKPAVGNSSDENKNSGKIVQFDLSSFESQKSKEGDSSSNVFKDESSGKMESSESISDCLKNKDSSPLGTSHSQDFPSLSTQENDSILSNQPGTSPTYVSSKKLEWDSGADIGYLNLDLTKENLSTIEKIVLKGLSSDGVSQKNVVYEKSPGQNQGTRSKFLLERKPSDLVVDAAMDRTSELESERDVDVCSGQKKERKRFTERANEEISSREVSKDEHGAKTEETKPTSSRESPSGSFAKKRKEIQTKERLTELKDKSLNVNTLFGNLESPSSFNQNNLREYKKLSESSSKPKFKTPKIGLSKSKKPSPQKLLKAPKKASISSINTKFLGSVLNMGVPKKVYKKVEATPAVNDAELSREVEEIIIDHRFEMKQNLVPGGEVTKNFESLIKDKSNNIKDHKTKNRPISASSCSNNTVLSKSENRENVVVKSKKNSEQCKVTDQIVQTSDYDCHSIGVQAFASQLPSDCDFKSSKKIKVSKSTAKENRANVNTSSKNIQAFGLTSSLPKQLEYPKEVELVDNHNTKSTQFFGGAINSLPNYHSNLVAKPAESCGRAPNILKAKKNLEAEVIRLKEENEKNILANDVPKFFESKKHCNNENKENFLNQKSTNSKRSHSDASRKNSKGNSASEDFDKKESEQKEKSPLVESQNSPQMSDGVSSMVLTSEVLKVHGDSIDRNIIQEKYFRSQLVELEKRKMISRSTSMELQLLQLDNGEADKEYKTTGCQYSVQSRVTTSDANDQDTGDKLFNENQNGKDRLRARLNQNEPTQNIAEDRFGNSNSITLGEGIGAGDSLPSSTQTAHSWIPGGQNSRENTSGVGKARSFEYLPGHIYESSGNLREKLPRETEKNLITSSSDSETPKRSISDGEARDSEGRNTLVLENSTICSQDSDRLKILDENLAQLNFAVLKLWEKDAQIQSVTQSLLANLWKKSGSGDFSALGGTNTSKTEVTETKHLLDNEKIRSNESSEMSGQKPENECSVACQAAKKSPSNHENFYKEKKPLKKRISEEKKSQIKWIENEIHHLNILRELLENPSSPIQRKKKLSTLTITSDDGFKSETNYSTKPSKEIHPCTATPVYGCTVSLIENPTEENQSGSEENDCLSRGKQPCSARYGMAVSLSGCPENWKPLVMLPIDVQVSLKNSNLLKKCFNKDEEENHSQGLQHSSKSSKSLKSNGVMVEQKLPTCDIKIQCPSARRSSVSIPSTSVQKDFQPPERVDQCTQESCLCINLSENCTPTVSRSSRSKTSERRGSSKLRFSTEKSCTESGSKTNNSSDFDLAETDSCRFPQAEKKKNSTESEFSGNVVKNDKSLQNALCKCQRAVEKSDSFGTFDKQTSIQSTGCKCPNCPQRLSSSISKPGIICKGTCQSSIYLNCDKPSEDVGNCHCSKIQVHKSLHCTCHIIKIHGSKCCSAEKTPCSCKRQSKTKKTENQFCQTDCAPIEVKNLCESKNTIEKKAQVANKLACDTKVAYEKVHPKTSKLVLEEKDAWERIPKDNVPVRIKSPLQSCSCRRRTEKEKAKLDNHPRHYFLRIEEAEVDDSCEQIKQKKSLEVITVTVPVKRAGKGKIYDTKNLTSNNNQKPSTSFVNTASKGCTCCAECPENCRLLKERYESYVSSDHRRSRPEKPESPTRNSGLLKRPQTCSSRDSKYLPCEELPLCSSSQEYFVNGNEFLQTESSHSQKPVSDSFELQCCEGCNCANRDSPPSREIQGEYYSHKKRKYSNVREFDDGNARYYDNKCKERISQNFTPQCDTEPCQDDWNLKSGHSRPQKLNVEKDHYNPDYYNYNKREFMTKSEILKEEEQKRKVHQPSLQECLTSNRPDFYDSAERRRQIISERARERVQKHNTRMDCLLKMMQQCNVNEQSNTGAKRIFTTVQMREQTMKKYKKLPEVTGKIADQKKKEEYRTNRLMADVFAKKLQIETLKGHTNLSNSVSVLHTL